MAFSCTETNAPFESENTDRETPGVELGPGIGVHALPVAGQTARRAAKVQMLFFSS